MPLAITARAIKATKDCKYKFLYLFPFILLFVHLTLGLTRRRNHLCKNAQRLFPVVIEPFAI